MKNHFSKTLLSAALSAAIGASAGPAASATLTIAPDLSGSNPLLEHPNFANGAARYLTNEIEQLKSGDTVRLMTFGARDNAANLINHQVKLSRKMRPKKVAGQVAQFVRALPEQAEERKQASTNLVAWLEFTSGFDCADNGKIIVLTDGLESSSLMSGRDFVNGKATLPKADVDLKGCHIVFYGLGAGWPSQSVKHVRGSWRNWADQAGATFEAIIP